MVNEQFRNGTMSTFNGRIRIYHLTPILYTFVEPSMIWGNYNATSLIPTDTGLSAGSGPSASACLMVKCTAALWSHTLAIRPFQR